MITKIGHVTVLVRDEDEALAFYCGILGFEKRSDVEFGPGMRWVTVGPPGQSEIEVVLQKPNPLMHGEEGARRLEARIGQGTTWVLHTDDIEAEYERLKAEGVYFTGEIRQQPWGRDAMFTDLYGNVFNLLQTPDHPSDT